MQILPRRLLPAHLRTAGRFARYCRRHAYKRQDQTVAEEVTLAGQDKRSALLIALAHYRLQYTAAKIECRLLVSDHWPTDGYYCQSNRRPPRWTRPEYVTLPEALRASVQS